MSKPATSPIPQGFTSVTPYLLCRDADEAIAFYKKAFGAVEVMRLPGPNGRVGHACLRIGNAAVMLAEPCMEDAQNIPEVSTGTGCSAVTIHLYVDDADSVFQQAINAGASVIMEPQDMFWGDRYARVTDPSGHQWSIATQKVEMTPEEMMTAMQQFCTTEQTT
ncbi:VOC family protein [Planctomicrobium sp. SH527]|uniref:VOC family protein n=1 Tax=Planctomicrobium sp. SH527 TaxID=3448123 RepID=UPI003F5C0AF2